MRRTYNSSMTTANKRCPSLSLPFPGRPQNTRRLIAGELPLRRVSLEPRIPREPGESKEPGDPIAFPASRKSVLRNSSSSSSSWGFPWEVFRSAVTSDTGTHLLTLTKGVKKGGDGWIGIERVLPGFFFFLEPSKPWLGSTSRSRWPDLIEILIS